MTSEKQRATTPGLLISVGGTPEPIAYSINHHRPEKVIFFASQSSRGEIQSKVRPLVGHPWADQEIITTSDPQDLTGCMEALVASLHDKLAVLGLTVEDLLVDYTGGTKTMSAALVLATIHEPVRYSYVGGRVRTKEGLGVVLDGSEAVVTSHNPWDVLAVDLRRRLSRQFNHGRFAEARETAAEAFARVGPRLHGFYGQCIKLCEAYQAWSGFQYVQAQPLLEQAVSELGKYADASGEESLRRFVHQLEQDRERLRRLVPAFRSVQKSTVSADVEGLHGLIVDLVAHAIRTVRLARRADDGVARLYSAVEKLAKVELAAKGINNSAAGPEQIPEALRAVYLQKYIDPESGALKFGLRASYELLEALGHPLGLRYRDHAPELDKLLGVRNGSLMVHGWTPIKDETFERMLEIILIFLNIEETELPALPRFPL